MIKKINEQKVNLKLNIGGIENNLSIDIPSKIVQKVVDDLMLDKNKITFKEKPVMKGCIIGSVNDKNKYGFEEIIKAGVRHGHKIDVTNWSELNYNFLTKPFSIECTNNISLLDYDYIILRSTPFKSLEGAQYVMHQAVAPFIKHLIDNGVFVLNGNSFVKLTEYNKLRQHIILSNANLPVIPTKVFFNTNSAKRAFNTFKKPMIAKWIYGGGGRYVKLVNTWEELSVLLETWGASNTLIQEKIDIKFDFRVLILGGKVLGVMKREAGSGEFRTNISLGGEGKMVKAGENFEKLGLLAAGSIDGDFIGVDIMMDSSGKPYIVELNTYSGFEGFEKATGISVGNQLIEFCEKKVSEKK